MLIVSSGIEKKCTLRLMGPFFLQSVAGEDITPNTQKWCALLAMLATAPNGRRSRKWLQDRLWSDSSERHGVEFEEWLREQREYWFNSFSAQIADRQQNDGSVIGDERVERSTTLLNDPLVLPPVVDAAIDHAIDNRQAPKNFAAAVLPLVNLTGDSQLDYFADGFSESLIDGLARLCWLPVNQRSPQIALSVEW